MSRHTPWLNRQLNGTGKSAPSWTAPDNWRAGYPVPSTGECPHKRALLNFAKSNGDLRESKSRKV